MAYVVPVHRASSVRHALKLRLLHHDEECLVVAKANRLEIYTQTATAGLALHSARSVYGTITMLNRLRLEASDTEHLFVGTDRFMYFTMAWNPDSQQLVTQKKHVDLAEPTARESQTGDRSHVDPSGRYMTLETFEGIVTVIPILQKGEIGALGEPMPARIAELFVKSSGFLKRSAKGAKDKPKFAVIYEDSHSKIKLKVRQLRHSLSKNPLDSGVEFEEVEAREFLLDYGATHLIPIVEPAGGALILGETSITYYDELQNDVIRRPLDEATIWCAWTQVDDQRFVLADDYGRLYLLMLILNNEEVESWQLDVIGETSRASTLVYLDAGHIFVGSHQGNSQVIRIMDRSMEIIQTFANIAPILDFTIMDMGNRSGEGQTNEFSSGQARIVTGSGAWNDGSLRSVRSGVGLEDLGMLGEMRNITDVFGVSSGNTTDSADTLVVSFIDETRVFRFSSDGEVEEVPEFAGLSLNRQTIFAVSLAQSQLLQVTSSFATTTHTATGKKISEWVAPKAQPITAVSHEGNTLMLSVGGTDVLTFDTTTGLHLKAQETTLAQGQISCIALSKAIPSIALVGFWQNGLISILDLESLNPIHTLSVDEDSTVSIPRSLLLTNIFPSPSPPTLFIAMADGNVVTYSVDPKTYELSARKSIVLGTQQASFKALPRDDNTNSVFAICEHPSLMYASEGRIVYSAVTAEKATCVCSFDAATSGYADAIAVATSEDLRIALIDKERTTHVQMLGIGETVRRIAYSPALKAFGMGTIKRSLVDGAEVVESHFKLADEVLFKELDDLPLNTDELVESAIRAELEDGTGGLAERFVVGTAFLEQPGEGDSVKGRILILEVSEEERRIKVVSEINTKGACRCLSMSQGRIVAGLIKSVVLYGFQQLPGQTPKILKKATYRTSTAPVDITVTGNIITVADLMKSVSLLEHTLSDQGSSGTDNLTEVARHYQSVWGTAAIEVGDNQYLESDAEGNLLLMRRDVDGVTEEDRKRLRVESEMCLGEMVNRMRRVNVTTPESAPVVPRAFLGTVEGSLYLFALISPRYLNLLIEMQRIVSDLVQSPGDIPFEQFRAFRSAVRQAEEPFRFVDGELMEQFLYASEDVQEAVVKQLKGTVMGMDDGTMDAEWLRNLVEGLRRLH